MDGKIYKKVKQWLDKNTYHHSEFSDIGELVAAKRGRKISVAIPSLNESRTIGKIIRTIKKDLMDRYPLVDEIVVVDSGSEDNTRTVAKAAGAKFYYCDSHPYFSEEEEAGKGSNLWASLYLTDGDIISWIDADIKNFESKFVYGPVGVILKNKRIGYVKSFYKRPLILDFGEGKDFSKLGGGRTTELCFRPLINIFFPKLTGFIQPLSGEYAGTREVLEKVPFYSGYGIETGLLINILDKIGLESMAQVDLDIRVHRNQDLLSLRKQAYIIANTILQEAKKRRRKPILDSKFYIPNYVLGQTNLDEIILKDTERPPITKTPSYKKKMAEFKPRLK